MHDVWCLYSTFPKKELATLIADNLLKENLIACANIIEGVSSLYMWEGKREQSAECIMLAKTQGSCVEQAIFCIKQLHSYEVPCVVAWKLEKGYPDFLQWVTASTVPAAPGRPAAE
jgi:periplasmic divalent cation tolerance protein